MPVHACVGAGLVLLVLCPLTRGATSRQAKWHSDGSGAVSEVAWAAIAAELGHTVSVDVNVDGIGHGQGRARRLIQSDASQVAQNISIDASGYKQAYDLFARTELTGYELRPVASSCGLDPQLDAYGVVADCANRQHACCLDASSSQNLTSLPQTLANICDEIALDGSVCQAFTLSTVSKTAYFYGQAPQQTIDLATATQPSQNTSLWVLDAANPADQRADHRASALVAAPQYSYYLSSLSNCPNSQEYMMDQVTGRFIIQGPQFPAQNLTTASPNASYAFFSCLTLTPGDRMTMTNGTCNTNPNITRYNSDLNSCAMAHSGGCCMDMSSFQGNASLAGHLADICNSMLLRGSVCVGFSYDTGTQLAFFKNQSPSQAVDVTAACVIPNVTLWVLTSALPGSMAPDDRPTALSLQPHMAVGPSPLPSSSGLSDAGSAIGATLGIGAPCLAIILWFAVTYSYRREKKLLVATVLENLRACDIAAADNLHSKGFDVQAKRLEQTESGSKMLPALDESCEGPTVAMRDAAKQMTQRCLRRWDSLLALRASKDSQGVGKGVWRERYQGVRASSMLLALFNLNKHLENTAVQQLKNPDVEAPHSCPEHFSCLLTAWQQSNHEQKNALLDMLAVQLHLISEETAQALPLKDREVIGLYAFICSWVPV